MGSHQQNPGQLLTAEERAQIALISSVVRFRKGEKVYEEGAGADAVFNIITGVVKSYKPLPDGQRHIVGFLFPDDLVGLAEEGRYVNGAEAVTDVTSYRIPVTALEARLRRDPGLEFHILARCAMNCASRSIMRFSQPAPRFGQGGAVPSDA